MYYVKYFKYLIYILFSSALFIKCNGFVMNDSKYFPQKVFQYSDDVSINYEVKGIGDKKIIFLHGFGASLNSWNDIKDLFPQNEYELFLLDLKGFGFSSKPLDDKYSIRDQAEIIHSFMKSLNTNEIYLIGHSFGGGVALLTYLISIENKEDSLIDKLVLIDCAAYPQDIPFFVQYLRTPILNHLIFLLPSKFRAEYTLKHLFYNSNKVNDAIVERYASFFSSENYKYTFIESACQILPDNYSYLISKYREIKIPTLIIWGKNDKALPVSNGVKLHNEISNSELKIIDKCGHIPQEEHPEETFLLINNFLKGK